MERRQVDSFPKNSQELVCVAIQECHGALVVDVRVAVIRTTGVKLLKKGLTIRATQLPRLIQALHKALDALEGLGEKPEKKVGDKVEDPDPWDELTDEELPF